jgi:hypothetical protein
MACLFISWISLQWRRPVEWTLSEFTPNHSEYTPLEGTACLDSHYRLINMYSPPQVLSKRSQKLLTLATHAFMGWCKCRPHLSHMSPPRYTSHPSSRCSYTVITCALLGSLCTYVVASILEDRHRARFRNILCFNLGTIRGSRGKGGCCWAAGMVEPVRVVLVLGIGWWLIILTTVKFFRTMPHHSVLHPGIVHWLRSRKDGQFCRLQPLQNDCDPS